MPIKQNKEWAIDLEDLPQQSDIDTRYKDIDPVLIKYWNSKSHYALIHWVNDNISKIPKSTIYSRVDLLKRKGLL